MQRRQAISNRMPAVAVEYDGPNGQRVSKPFADAYKARQFYTAQAKQGKHPAVKAAK